MSIMTTSRKYQVIIIKTITHLQYLQRHPLRKNGGLPPLGVLRTEEKVISVY